MAPIPNGARPLVLVLALFIVGVASLTLAAAAPGYTGSNGPGAGTDTPAPPGEEEVTVTVTMDGEPKDAQVVVRNTSGSVVAVRYTNPHTPGRADFSLAPGQYEFEIDSGGGFVAEKAYRNVTVDSYEIVDVELDRKYEPNDRGYYAGDLHAHSIYSADTTDSPMDEFVAAQLAADLDILFISDHNSVQGHSPLKEHARERGVPYLLSDELSTDIDADRAVDRLQPADPTNETSGGTYGHFNVYPIEEGRQVDWTGDPDDFFASARDAGATIIQANHPRRDNNYFHHVDSAEYNESYETAEAYNDNFNSDEVETIDQLFDFWNQSYRYTATAVSDDHESSDLGDEYANPRTYAYMEEPPRGVAAGFAKAVDNQNAFITYGPLVYFQSAGGAIPGENVSAPDGEVTLTADIRNVGELESATLVRNGTVVRNYTLSGRTATITHEAEVNGSAWYILRVQDEDGAIGTRAMTNPIWVSESGFGEHTDVVAGQADGGVENRSDCSGGQLGNRSDCAGGRGDNRNDPAANRGSARPTDTATAHAAAMRLAAE
ncbi:MAG: hypothetical protein ACI80F_000618 [Natronomonas sp.]|jgi:hypothetical protein|uniref:CehA/McbA family metallohydrolase n=1 Tax=Natronomonas sp. TaxID=2184060 RepID=UPI003988E03D